MTRPQKISAWIIASLFAILAITIAVRGESAEETETAGSEEIEAVGPAETETVVTEDVHEDPGFDRDTDYMRLMIDAVMSGSVNPGREAEIKRNRKIDALELEYPHISFNELYMLARVMTSEAGSSWLSDEHQRLVGSVVLNRVASPEFPDTMEEVLNQPRQYNSAWRRMRPLERTAFNALHVLENGSLAPASVVFQAEFRQGSGVWHSIYDRILGTTYFCHSSKPWLYE